MKNFHTLQKKVKNHEKHKRKNTKIDSKYAIYKFASFDDYCNFVKYLKNHNLSLSYKVAKNILLYLYKEDYYIVFDNINLKYSNIAKFNSAIIEFAKFISNSSLFICKWRNYYE